MSGVDSAVRRQIGTVLQNGRINAGSLFENIVCGTRVPLNDAWDAARATSFADEIKAIGRRQGLHVMGFAPNTVKKFICGNGRASKAEVARVVIARYPELKVFLTQDRAWKEPNLLKHHHVRMLFLSI